MRGARAFRPASPRTTRSRTPRRTRAPRRRLERPAQARTVATTRVRRPRADASASPPPSLASSPPRKCQRLVLAAAEGAEADRERSPALAASFDDVPLRSRDSAALAFGAVTYRWAKLSLGTRNGEQPSGRLSALQRRARSCPLREDLPPAPARLDFVGEPRDTRRLVGGAGAARFGSRCRPTRADSPTGAPGRPSQSPRARGGSIRGSLCGKRTSMSSYPLQSGR